MSELTKLDDCLHGGSHGGDANPDGRDTPMRDTDWPGAPPNAHRELPPKEDPGLPPGPHNELFARLRAVVDQFGRSMGKRSRSRRHGFEPLAKQHVEDYLSVQVLGVSMRSLARARGVHHSTVWASVKRGARLVREQADARGFDDPFPDQEE